MKGVVPMLTLAIDLAFAACVSAVTTAVCGAGDAAMGMGHATLAILDGVMSERNEFRGWKSDL